MSVVRIITYIVLHMIDVRMLISVAFMIPAALTGMFAGNKIHQAMSEELFKKITSVILLISGILVILKNL